MNSDLIPVTEHFDEVAKKDGCLDPSLQNRVMILGQEVRFWIWTEACNGDTVPVVAGVWQQLSVPDDTSVIYGRERRGKNAER